MPLTEQKQRARERRERKFRRRLATLSWTVPVVAFGSFFSIWHGISAAVNPSTTAQPSHSVASNSVKVNEAKATQSTKTASSVLFKIGSKGQQVSVIQQQLHELGYFNHLITEYYGPVTAQAVEAFQSAQHLTKTGEMDTTTFNALQQAVKNHLTSNLVSTGSTTGHSNPPVHHVRHSVAYHSTHSTSTVAKSPQTTSKSSASTTSSAAVSQQTIPQTSSSAS